jgi:hypothetical protein
MSIGYTLSAYAITMTGGIGRGKKKILSFQLKVVCIKQIEHFIS